MMDVAMGALMTKGEFRDALLSGYTNIISKRVEIEQLEAFMFLAIVGYYTYIVGQKNKHKLYFIIYDKACRHLAALIHMYKIRVL